MKKFKEENLPSSFCEKEIILAKKLIADSVTFTAVGMPTVGLSFFLRFLATNPFNVRNYFFIHIDIYSMSEISKMAFLKLLAKQLGLIPERTEVDIIQQIKTKVLIFTRDYKRVVIIFNRFDQVKKILNEELIAILYSLREQDKEKIVMVFSASKPMVDFLPRTISGPYLYMFSRNLYVKPFNNTDLISAYSLNNPLLKPTESIKKLILLSGGHHQLFQFLVNTERFDDPLMDKMIRTRLKELYDYLRYSQKKQLQKIVSGEGNKSIDPYLLNVGMVVQSEAGLRLFSPLLQRLIVSISPLKLPAKENKLFRLLSRNINSIVSKDEIINTLWPVNPQEVTDWALNSLIYRLKKNPWFVENGYFIENQKKLGYIMYKN
jgi:hypothetical protein